MIDEVEKFPQKLTIFFSLTFGACRRIYVENGNEWLVQYAVLVEITVIIKVVQSQTIIIKHWKQKSFVFHINVMAWGWIMLENSTLIFMKFRFLK